MPNELSEAAAGIVELAKSSLSRRRVLQAAGIGGVAMVATACGASGSDAGTATGAPSAATAADLSDTEKTANWSNWPLYLDINDDTGEYLHRRCERQQ